MDSPEFPGYHHVKDLGKDTSVTRTRTTTLPEQLLTCFGFWQGKEKRGHTANRWKVKDHLPALNEHGRQGRPAVPAHVVRCLLIPYAGETPSDSSTQRSPGSSAARPPPLQLGRWNEPIQTWWRQQTHNNVSVATALPGPIPSPVSIHTPPYCSLDNDRADCNCRGVLRRGGEADKEYLSLLSAQVCKSLLMVLWGTEQKSCVHSKLRC